MNYKDAKNNLANNLNSIINNIAQFIEKLWPIWESVANPTVQVISQEILMQLVAQ